MFKAGDTIEYLANVSSPPSQKGCMGQTKIVDRDIPVWTANYLLRGGLVRPFDPASPLKIKTEKKKERSTKTNGQGKTKSGSDQAGGHGPARSDSKRRT